MDIEAIVQEIKASPKYQTASEETIRGLVQVEASRHKKERQVIKAVRKRLHGIMAYYLGDADYPKAEKILQGAFAQGKADAIKDACRAILMEHPSTQERLEILDVFYPRIFEVTGKPNSMLDLACGLNPLTFPWMGLPLTFQYHAYDIHKPRVALINAYFKLQGLAQLAREQDVIFNPPQENADVALILKELPRLDRNYHGGGSSLLEALQVQHVVVSFPAVSLHGGRDLKDHYRSYMEQMVKEKDWPLVEISFPNELVYCLNKAR